MEIPRDILERLIETTPVARLATLRANGRAHLVPIVFARSDGLLWSAVDGKPKRAGTGAGDLARLANVRRRPEVTLLLDHYDVDWTRLWWIRIAGAATVREPARADDDPEVARALNGLRAKYPQYADTPLVRDRPVLLAIRPEAVASWCAGPAALAVAT